MLVNADFNKPAVVTRESYEWVPSPQSGVERVMLDRIGAERGRATSIVRYAPRSSFPRHAHPGGEEILVLSGTFSDELGDYPAGWYLRNPPGSAHQPSSQDGTVILVKLWQMRATDQETVRINSCDPANWRSIEGREICPLFKNDVEQVQLLRLPPNSVLLPCAVESAEFLILEGDVISEDQRLEQGSWVRLPRGTYADFKSGGSGVTIFLKTGHLPETKRGLSAC
jgi:hypothetical protein